MSNVTIRQMEEKDLPALKLLILEAFGEGWNLARFDHSKAHFQALLELYQSMFLNASTFGKVAVLGGEIVGAVLIAAKGETEKFRQWQADIVPNTLALLAAPEAERNDILEHLSVSFQTISQLLEDRVDRYDGSLEFIAVSKQAQGLGIGKALWNQALSYLHAAHVQSIYLITDSACNTGFYDNNGFSQVSAKDAVYSYSSGQKRSTVFVYEYQLEQ
ncbi:MAG: GNAT family N-acetyltransferase [Oscillospiraceae bacterium]|nr:GNAT family N-acetyltransferase [Oscillospiraceae bacterium]